MKRFFEALAFIAFFYILGTVGALEHDVISFGAAVMRIGIGFICFWIFFKLSGCFPTSSKQRKSR